MDQGQPQVVEEQQPKSPKPLLKYLVLSFFIILPIVAFYGGMKYQQQSRQESVTLESTPSTIQQNDEYVNIQYGYKFSYPKSWIKIESATEADITLTQSNVETDPTFTVTTHENLPGLGMECLEIVEETPVTVVGINVTKTTFTSGKECGNTHEMMGWVVLQNGSYTHILQMMYDPSDQETADETFNQIFSSFQFTDSNDEMSGWEELKIDNAISSKKNFTLYYPNNWELIQESFPSPEGFRITLSNGSSELTILQGTGDYGRCTYPGDEPFQGMGTRYGKYSEITKGEYIWRVSLYPYDNPVDSYAVCELSDGEYYSTTSIGYIDIKAQNQEHFEVINEILSKIEII